MARARSPDCSSIKAFILDLDGTTYLGDRLLPGVRAFLQRLRDAEKRFGFYTNNSSYSVDEYRRKLTRLGIPVHRDQIVTSADATIAWLQNRRRARRIFLIGTPSLEEEFTRAGFKLVDRNVDTVVIGFDRTLTYAKLETACRLIRGGARLVATHPDLVCPTPTGPIPDCGAMIALITTATGVHPVKVCGKPDRIMLRTAMRRLGSKRDNTVVIGDRLYTDIRMGAEHGVKTILVLTGEATRAEARRAPYRPDHVVETLADIRL